ncbi:hypothetical protein CR513_62124, partial [Mucuna pruriens]
MTVILHILLSMVFGRHCRRHVILKKLEKRNILLVFILKEEAGKQDKKDDILVVKSTFIVLKLKKMLLGDYTITIVVGTREVELRFTFGKSMVIKNVMHTPKTMKNSILGYLFNKEGSLKLLKLICLSLQKIFFGGEDLCYDEIFK